jgi:CRISPR system Cascade subunit CasA
MHAWHAFLVQLAAIALHHAGEEAIARNAENWRALLRALTEDRDEPWCLVVEDLAQPAFMQPPVPERSLAKWKNATTCPDEIDLLVTAKNHDVKRRRIQEPRSEHWVYALITLQTMEGYGGSTLYGIARMNGAYGNRPCIAVARDSSWPTRFVRDVKLLLDQRSALVTRYGYRTSGGQALLWLLPWDGNSSEGLSNCDPLFIEVCRRVRLAADGGAPVARWIGSEMRRLGAKDRKGDVGDPWTPVERDGTAFGKKNLSYETLQEVLFGADWSPSPASQPRPEDGEAPLVVAQVFARGKGGTKGLHERLIPIPPKARNLFATPEGRGTLGVISKERIQIVDTLKKKVLRPVLLTLMQADPTKLDFKDSRARPFMSAMDGRLDAVFFEWLFNDVDRDRALAKRDFTRRAIQIARAILDDAIDSVPFPGVRRHRAIAAAERRFERAARKWFQDVYLMKGDETHDRAVGT